VSVPAWLVANPQPKRRELPTWDQAAWDQAALHRDIQRDMQRQVYSGGRRHGKATALREDMVKKLLASALNQIEGKVLPQRVTLPVHLGRGAAVSVFADEPSPTTSFARVDVEFPLGLTHGGRVRHARQQIREQLEALQ
jgi:hypothetical protein